MADVELRELLTEFQNLAESEHHSFLNTVVNNFSYSSTIFGALILFEDRPKPSDLLQPLCDLLFSIYRDSELQFRQFTLQFLPALAYLYLQNCGAQAASTERQGLAPVETLLVAIHNLEVGKEAHPRHPAFKVPSLNVSSIYHESTCISESRILPPSDTHEKEKDRGLNVKRPTPLQITAINAQNRGRVMDSLFGVYTSLLGEYAKPSLELSCRLCTRMVTRGFYSSGPSRKSHRRNTSYGSDSSIRSPRVCQTRVYLPSSVFLELIHLGYFAIFNGYASIGSQLVKDIEFRGRHDSMANVLLTSRAVLQLAVRAAGSPQEPHMATPSQLTKNMITNASFRTKKMEADIARVETDEEGERMGVISEEAEQDDKGSGTGQEKINGPDDKVNIADKIKAKMENVRENVRMPDGMRIRKKEKEKERGLSEASEGREENRKERNSEKREKRREKLKSESRSNQIKEDNESDEMIRLQTLPSETVIIHSPESGNTSIF